MDYIKYINNLILETENYTKEELIEAMVYYDFFFSKLSKRQRDEFKYVEMAINRVLNDRLIGVYENENI